MLRTVGSGSGKSKSSDPEGWLAIAMSGRTVVRTVRLVLSDAGSADRVGALERAGQRVNLSIMSGDGIDHFTNSKNSGTQGGMK